MKIGLVCPYDIFRPGGVQECVLALQSGLEQRGHKAVILTPLSRDSTTKSSQNVIFLGGGTAVKSPFHTTAQVSASASPDVLNTVLEKEKFDVLHFHEPWVPMLARQLLTRSNSVNVATFHAKLPETIMSRTIERVITPYTKSILKNLNVLTAVSDSAADYVKSLTNKPIKIIPNGIDLSKYTPNTKPTTDNKKILYIGRLERRKGVKFLIKAYALVAESNSKTELLIAGDGPDRQKLEEYARELGLHNINFLGYVNEKQKLDLLAQADLFCSPALYGESFGIVLLEAMASNTVVVAGNNPGYSSVMKGRGSLSIVNPKDSGEFARRISLLLSDEVLRGAWSDWAQDYVKQFDYENVIDQYEQLYKQAVQTR